LFRENSLAGCPRINGEEKRGPKSKTDLGKWDNIKISSSRKGLAFGILVRVFSTRGEEVKC